MKAIIFKIIAIITIVIGIQVLNSCDNEQKNIVQEEINKQEVFNELRGKIDLLNQSFSIPTSDITPRSFGDLDVYRPFTPELITANRARWWQVALADVIGAAVGTHYFGPLGGVGLGALASWQTATGGGGFVLQDDPMNDVSLFIGNDLTEMSAEQIGYYHNVILQQIMSDNPNLFATATTQDMIEAVIAVSADFGFDIYATGLSANWLNEQLTATQQLLDQYSEIEVFDVLATRYPKQAAEFEIMRIYMDNVSRLEKARAIPYTLQFSDIVASVNLPEESSDMILSAVSTGINSKKLWRTNVPNPAFSNVFIEYTNEGLWQITDVIIPARCALWGVPRINHATGQVEVFIFGDYIASFSNASVYNAMVSSAASIGKYKLRSDFSVVDSENSITIQAGYYPVTYIEAEDVLVITFN